MIVASKINSGLKPHQALGLSQPTPKSPLFNVPMHTMNHWGHVPMATSRLCRQPHVRLVQPCAVAAKNAPKAQKSVEPAAPTAAATAFLELGVDPLFAAGLGTMGISSPSPIQAAAVPAVLSGDNVAIQSYTGSGKTLAYLLPVLTIALARAEAFYTANSGAAVPVQALIVAPSQELAMQIVRVAQALLPAKGRNMVQQCIGGANPMYQRDALERNQPIVVVGTPGRLAEFVRGGVLRLHGTPLLVLDEADQLLSPQFFEDMTHLHGHVGKRLGAAESRKASKAGKDAGTNSAAPEAQASSSTGTDGQGGNAPAGASSPSPSPWAEEPAPVPGRWSMKPTQRQTVIVSATLTQSVLSKITVWCPSPQYITAGGPAPTMAPPEEAAKKAAAAAAETSTPEWGWGVKGWDGPASTAVGPRTQGSAGGVEQEGLLPTMPPQLRHMYVVTSPSHKVDTLRRVIHALDAQRALVFMNWQQRLRDVQFKLEARAMEVAVLHGEMGKVQRANTLNDFRRGRVRALVVSDVVARGLDVNAVDAVFHGELPSSASHYAHRAGRTGRMGAPGIVVSLVTPSEAWVVDKLAAKLGVEIQEMHVAFGELRPGPAPADLRDQEEASTSKAAAAGTAGGSAAAGAAGKAVAGKGAVSPVPVVAAAAAAGVRVGKAASAPEAAAAAVGSKGRAASPEQRLPAGGPAGKQAGASKEAAGTKPGSKEGGTAIPGDLKLPKGARTEADAEGVYDLVIYDDDDEIELEDDDEEFDPADLVHAPGTTPGPKGLGGGRGAGRGRGAGAHNAAGRGAGRGAVRGPPGWTAAGRDAEEQGRPAKIFDAKAELKRELEELKAEKAKLRAARGAGGKK